MAIATTTAIALGLAAASAAASAYNTHQTAKRADNAAAEGIRAQSENQRRANEAANKAIKGVGESDASDARATASKQYLDQVQRSLAQADAGLAQRGLSSEFDARAGGAAAANAKYGADTAGLLARMDAPLLQRAAEGNLVGDTGMDLSRIAGDVQGTGFLNDLKLKGVRRNPFIDAVAGLMQGAATSGLGSGAGAAANSAGAGAYGAGAGAANAAAGGMGALRGFY